MVRAMQPLGDERAKGASALNVLALALSMALVGAAPVVAQAGDGAQGGAVAADESGQSELGPGDGEAPPLVEAIDAEDADPDLADAEEAAEDGPEGETLDEDAAEEAEDTEEVEEEAEEVDEDLARDARWKPRVGIHGEYRLRFHVMNDLPLHTEERTGFPDRLGQNYWATQWLRLTGELRFGDAFRIVGQIDVADGVVFGEDTQGVTAAEIAREDSSAFARSGFDPRWLYLDWTTPAGVVRAGLQPSHWGLGLLANDGTKEPPFGDYRYGNSNLRLLFATRPFGQGVPFTLALAGDLVYQDPLAELSDGERALQGVIAAFAGDPEDDVIGAYFVRRSQQHDAGESSTQSETLDVWVLDLFAKATFTEPSGGEMVLAFEGVHIRGDTTFTRTVDRERDDVRQWLWAAQAGRRTDVFDAFLEAGFTSGDSNTEDGVQRRATMHPDHRIGLILFPEVIAWNTARAATLAGADALVGRPSPGSDLLPTNGGVSGATYLFNWYTVRPTKWLDLKAGWIWARATSDIVDPYRQRSQSRSVSYLGGDSGNRDLGLELDASVMFHFDLKNDIRVQIGLEGGVFFPGHAFDDATGNGMDTLGLGRIRAAFMF